jgi:hypothetical protein
MIIARKAQNISSPYSQMMQQVAANSGEMAKNGSLVEVVSKLILGAVTSENPNLRYLAGKDVETRVVHKKTMSDTEFHSTIKNLAR